MLLLRLIKADHHAGLRGQINVFASDGQNVTASGERSNGETLKWAAESRAIICCAAGIFHVADSFNAAASPAIHGYKRGIQRKRLAIGQNGITKTHAQLAFALERGNRGGGGWWLDLAGLSFSYFAFHTSARG